MLHFLAAGKNDWQWLYDCVVTSLRKLHDDGFQVVLFTNQAGIEKMKVKPEDLMEKIDAIVMELEIPCFVSPSTFYCKFFTICDVILFTSGFCLHGKHQLPQTKHRHLGFVYIDSHAHRRRDLIGRELLRGRCCWTRKELGTWKTQGLFLFRPDVCG